MNILDALAEICNDIIKAARNMVNILETENLQQEVNQIDINPFDYDTFNCVCGDYILNFYYEEYKARISKANNNPTNSIKYKILI